MYTPVENSFEPRREKTRLCFKQKLKVLREHKQMHVLVRILSIRYKSESIL